MRMRFMTGDDKKPVRVEAYMLPPRLKIHKDLGRVVRLNFSVKMSAYLANACDELIRVAWEDCEFREREITSVQLKSEVENTDIEFYDLMENKRPAFVLRNVTLESLGLELSEGTTYLYFVAEAKLSTEGLGVFALSHFGYVVFCDFHASQFAMLDDEHKQIANEVQGIVKQMDDRLKKDGATATLIGPGGETLATFGKSAPDPIYRDAVLLVVEHGKASTVLLQRRLRIGYGRAAGLLDHMQNEGIIGAPDGAKPREILKRPEWLDESAGEAGKA